MAAAFGGSALAEDAVGHWVGMVKTPIGVELTIVAHLKPAVAGGLEGFAESPDQMLTPLPLSDVKATPESLEFTIGQVKATFAGKWDPLAKGWVGVMDQNGFQMPLTLKRGVAPPRPVVAGLDGDWSGMIASPQGDLRILVHVKTDKDGTLALLESPDQTPIQMVAFLTRESDVVSVTLRGIGGFFGQLSTDGKALEEEGLADEDPVAGKAGQGHADAGATAIAAAFDLDGAAQLVAHLRGT
eukprot:gene9173-12390_t